MTELDRAYQILGASKEDSDTALKDKYRKLILKYHPDRHMSDDVLFYENKTKEINAAYSVVMSNREGRSDGSDWDISLNVRVVVNKPPRPKGLENRFATIARSIPFYSCDFWNIWEPTIEDRWKFNHSLHAGVVNYLGEYQTIFNRTFYFPIYDRLVKYAQSEYIDAERVLCSICNIQSLDSVVLLSFPCQIPMPADILRTEATLLFSENILDEPFALSIVMQNGNKLGPISSHETMCLYILAKQYGARIRATIASNFSESHANRPHSLTTIEQSVRVHIKVDLAQTCNTFLGYACARKEINELHNIYSRFKDSFQCYTECNIYANNDLAWLFSEVLEPIPKPVLHMKPIYELAYRVFEVPSSVVDGRAYCPDLTFFSMISSTDCHLLSFIYDRFNNYSALTKYSNSKTKFYHYKGDGMTLIIRMFKKKSPNGTDHWHDIKLMIFAPC